MTRVTLGVLAVAGAAIPIARQLASERGSFDVELAHGTAEPGQTVASGRRLLRLSGEWVDATIAAPPDTMSLVGWKIVPRDAPERTFRAEARPPYRTLGELRRALQP